MALVHKGSHWGPQAMCNVVLRTYGCFLSPYRMLYRIPDLGNYTSNFFKNYILTISTTLLSLRLKDLPAQTPPPQFNSYPPVQEITS
jgi:hypothetical protein